MIVRNWTNINKNSFNIDHSNLDITYNSKPVLIQIPKGRIIPHPQIFNNPRLHFINVSLSYNKNNTTNSFYKFINELEQYIINITKSKLKISKSTNTNDSKLYLNLSIQVYNNEPIISIFDPYKKKQNMSYIIPQSSAICLISPKNIWKSKDKIGINWVLVQTKIFQPIIKIDECLIMDEFDEQPLLNYHNIDNKSPVNEQPDISEDEDELKTKYQKFIKMKKMGVPIGAIQVEMTKFPDLDINEFLKLIGEKQIDTNIPSPPKFKLVLPKRKPAEKQKAPQNTSGQTSGAFRPPSQADIKNMLAKLKPTKSKLKE